MSFGSSPSDEAKRLGLHPGDQVDVQMARLPDIKSIFGLMRGKLPAVQSLMREIDDGAD